MQKIIKRRSVDQALAALAGNPPVLQRVFAARGVTHPRELDYRLTHLIPPTLKGLDAATALLLVARERQQRVMIIGDFDADGATSTALVVRCLRVFGFDNVAFMVPNRFEFGYGLTPEIVDVAAEQSPDLIVTVDNGISSHEGVARARQLGIAVLITDHHLPGDSLPEADAIVNPNQPGCEFLSKHAAGVGVIFYLMMALRKGLRERNWFNADTEPKLTPYLDLVALGTVADVVPLDFNNRVLVAQGLKRIRAGAACPGIKAIASVAGRDCSRLDSADLGFAVAPRLNAAGRLDDMSLGIKCLLADGEREAQAYAQELDALNRERRAIESAMQKEALALLGDMDQQLKGQLPAAVCLYNDQWHQGVIGILASRIKDRLHRPVLVFASESEGQLKGSGRSVPGLHLRDLLDKVAKRYPHLLSKFGGHAMAAGLSIRHADLETFREVFAEEVAKSLGSEEAVPVVETDGPLERGDFTFDLAQQIQSAGPWGQAFPEPMFDGEFDLVQQRLVGEKHLKMVLAQPGDGQQTLDAIAFGVDLECWPNEQCRRVRLAYKLSINEFRGRRSVQLLVDYIEPVGVSR